MAVVPRSGTFGDRTRARVYTNTFELPLAFNANATIFHYDVISPGWEQKTEVKFSTLKGREILVRLQQDNPQIFNPVAAFDGKRNLFSFKRYSFASHSFQVQLDTDDGRRRPRLVLVIITFAREVNLEIFRNLREARIPKESLSSALNLLNVFIQAQPREIIYIMRQVSSNITDIPQIKNRSHHSSYGEECSKAFDQPLIELSLTWIRQSASCKF
ncbi:hypothetical protein B0H19DRAFT_252839 [Mycena capillaripes]|nr:hypothetical protein B0H19DRAFT_252839 [Mycena capillaripes]